MSEKNRNTPTPGRSEHSHTDAQKWREKYVHEKRYRREKRFRAYTIAAVLIAATFLAIFLVDLVIKGYPALRQAEILAEITYTSETMRDVETALPEEVRDLVSRAATRSIARKGKRADVRVDVYYSEKVKEDPAAAIEVMAITQEDMPPWKRDFQPVEVPREHLMAMIGDRELETIRQNFTENPSLAGTTKEEWLAASPGLVQFLTDSTGLSEGLMESAELLHDADHLRRGFNEKEYGEEGATVEEWILADSHVDQYLKGYDFMQPESYDDPGNAPIGVEKAARIDRLHDEGRIRLAFNHYFFLNGDSKIPEAAGLRAAVIGSVYVLCLVFFICLPIGVMTSIYLEEFAPDNFLTQTIEVNINNLAAIPSILFGVLGLAAFINFFGMPRSSVLVGSATLALMTLPIVIISTRAALRAVPDSVRRAGFAMGATRWQVVLHHVMPLSISGIMTGSIIGIAQAMGETAPLIIIGLVAFVPEAPTMPTDSTTVMPAQIFSWWGMSLRAFQERAALAILVLLIVLFFLNGLAVFIRARSERSW